jgi:hypothetical protein
MEVVGEQGNYWGGSVPSMPIPPQSSARAIVVRVRSVV